MGRVLRGRNAAHASECVGGCMDVCCSFTTLLHCHNGCLRAFGYVMRVWHHIRCECLLHHALPTHTHTAAALMDVHPCVWAQVGMMTWSEVLARLVLAQRTLRLSITRDLDELDIVARIMRKVRARPAAHKHAYSWQVHASPRKSCNQP